MVQSLFRRKEAARGSSKKNEQNSEPEDDDGSDDEGEDAANKKESRGQMVQRHKREAKAVKEKVKRMGKKGKEEGTKLLKEMEERHEKELQSLEMGDEESDGQVQAVAATLYGTSISSPKKTKAQKKREQRLKEEEEREARIAAENEARGESEREIEERALSEILQLESLELKDIPSDGHCLYKSLEDQLTLLGDGGQMAVATSAGLQQPLALDFQSLRSICAKSLRERRTEFEAFVIEADVSNRLDDCDPFEAYCQEVENTAAWGGHVEIQALSEALRVHIRIFRTGSTVLSVGEQYADDNTTLNICYLQHAFGLGEHYNSTRPIVVS